MKMAVSSQIVLSIIFCAVGLGAGWYLASAGRSANHDDAAAAPESVLSKQALANMGVEVGNLRQVDYAVSQRVPARVAATPQSFQPVILPVAGKVISIDVKLGQKVKAGDVIAKVLRDAFPRPELSLTEEVLQPASEDYHGTKGELRKVLKSAAILDAELRRLESFRSKQDDIPLVPRQNIINLRYEKSKVEQEISNLRLELRLHGLSDQQIKEIESGKELILNLQIWHAILKRNGIWNDRAEELLSVQRKRGRKDAWTIAAIGELVTQDLLSEGLVTWLAADEDAAKAFIPIAALLLEGQTLERIKWLKAKGAFEPVVILRAPASAKDWDVIAIHVKEQEQLDAAASLVTLANPRQLYLEAEPVGSEIVSLNNSIKTKLPVKSTSLIPGAGPTMEGLLFSSISQTEENKTVARLLATNTVIATTKDTSDREFRTWALRPGMKYMLHVPVRYLKKVYVVPTEAVVTEGADRVLYVQNGDTFLPAKVVVLHETASEVVLGPKSDIFPGDPVALSKAFALKLALMAEKSGPIDPHAGHNH